MPNSETGEGGRLYALHSLSDPRENRHRTRLSVPLSKTEVYPRWYIPGYASQTSQNSGLYPGMCLPNLSEQWYIHHGVPPKPLRTVVYTLVYASQTSQNSGINPGICLPGWVCSFPGYHGGYVASLGTMVGYVHLPICLPGTLVGIYTPVHPVLPTHPGYTSVHTVRPSNSAAASVLSGCGERRPWALRRR